MSMDKFHYCSRHKHYECAGSIPCDICSIVDDRDELKDGVKQLEKERDELRANWEGLKTELKNAAKLDVLFGEDDEVAKVSVVATLNVMSKLEGGK